MEGDKNLDRLKKASEWMRSTATNSPYKRTSVKTKVKKVGLGVGEFGLTAGIVTGKQIGRAHV